MSNKSITVAFAKILKKSRHCDIFVAFLYMYAHVKPIILHFRGDFAKFANLKQTFYYEKAIGTTLNHYDDRLQHRR